MSFDTRITARSGFLRCRWMTTARIWLSALAVGRPVGSSLEMASVCRNSASARQLVRRAGERDAVVDRLAVAADDVVKRSRDLPCVARDFREPRLVVVELFERHDRQEDVVFLETVDAGRIVQQHVGVENEELGQRGGGRLGARCILMNHWSSVSCWNNYSNLRAARHTRPDEIEYLLRVARRLDGAPFAP